MGNKYDSERLATPSSISKGLQRPVRPSGSKARRGGCLLGWWQAGERFFFSVFIHLGGQTLSISSSCHTTGHVLVTGAVWREVLTSSFLPGMFTAKAQVGLGGGGPGHLRPPAAPSPPAAAAAGARRGLPGQRLCFPDSNYVCGSAASTRHAGGAGGSLPQHPTKMTPDTEGGGGREGAAGERGPEQRQRRTLVSEPRPRSPFPGSRCARLRCLPALRLGPSGAGEARAGLRAPSPHSGPDSPAAAAAALSCAGRGEPCPRSAGRWLGAPGRRLSG